MLRTLTLDIGNSRVKAAVFCDDDLKETWSCEADKLALELDGRHFDACAVSLVGREPEGLWDLLMGCCERVVRVDGETPAAIRNGYDDSAQLGADRWAAAVGAWKLHSGRPLLVVDAGTCLTCDFISREGVFKGGVIAPGVSMRLQAMHQHTARLPEVAATKAPTTMDFPARNTADAMLQGAYLSARMEVEGYIRLLLQENPDLHVCLTGGTELAIDDDLAVVVSREQHLVHVGLKEILRKGR